jgi:hypothetical protein
VQKIGTHAQATQPVLRSSRWHLHGGEHKCSGPYAGGDIPLNAIYTLVDISTNFTTSDGLNPNDIALELRRA